MHVRPLEFNISIAQHKYNTPERVTQNKLEKDGKNRNVCDQMDGSLHF